MSGSALALIKTVDRRQRATSEKVDDIQYQVRTQAKAARQQEMDIQQIQKDLGDSRAKERATEASIQEILRRIDVLEDGQNLEAACV